MLRFKEYRLKEGTSQPSNASPTNAMLDKLERDIYEIIDIQITNLMKDLRQRGNDLNPFDVMRQSQPWHRKVRNWWNRFWHNDTTGESQDYGLEFPDEIALHEQEAFNELTDLMEGPVNQAIANMEAKLQNLRYQMHTSIQKAFAIFRQYNQQVPTTSPQQAAPHSQGVPQQPGQSQPGVRNVGNRPTPPPPAPAQDDENDPNANATDIDSDEYSPDDEFEPKGDAEQTPGDVGDSEDIPGDAEGDAEEPQEAPGSVEEPQGHVEPPEAPYDVEEPQGDPGNVVNQAEPEPVVPKRRGRKPRDPNAPKAPRGPRTPPTLDNVQVSEIKNGEYGLAKKAMVDGHMRNVSHVNYDRTGKLVAIRVKGINGIIPVPPEIGLPNRINYGYRSGSIKDIRRAIQQGQWQDDPTYVAPPQQPSPPPRERAHDSYPTNWIGVKGDPNRGRQPVENPQSIEGDYDDASELPAKDAKGLNKMRAADEREAKLAARTHEDKVMEWVEEYKDVINPKLLNIIMSPPTPQFKDALMAFMDGLSDHMKIAVFSRRNGGMLDTDVDLGKLDWIAQMGPQNAHALAQKIDMMDNDDPDFRSDLASIFRDENSLNSFLTTSEHSMSRSNIFVENLRRKAVNPTKTIKNASPRKQVTHYKNLLRSK